MNKKIENTIIKYFSKSASFEELIELTEWLDDKTHINIFADFAKTNYLIDATMIDFDTEAEKEKILNQIKEKEKQIQKFKFKNLFKYAAFVAIIIVGGYFYLKNDNFSYQLEKNNTQSKIEIKPGYDKATLILGDGSEISLEKGTTTKTKNANSNGEKIVYQKSEPNKKNIEYNYLTIPRGGQFQITLSDGTQVWLNSESQLKYPVNFKVGASRKVELVYGEAYFDVSPSTAHKGSTFTVINQSQEVEVLGTEFNIKAYKEENNIYTTLVEGKVAVTIDNKKQKLIPNQQLSLDTKTNTLTLKDVDVFNEISWKNGIFSFEDKSLKDIMKVLSRWYDIEVLFKNKAIENEMFFGILRKNQKIEDILTSIKNFGNINNFTIDDKKVILE